jgi:dethiobiotin synthetase
MNTRPRRLVVVTGTATGIGKTWVAATLARHLRQHGLRVGVRKPAQSFDADIAAECTDAAVLADASGETATTVCPPHRWYSAPLAPPMAAQALGRPPFVIDDLTGEITRSWAGSAPLDVGLVEGAGGVASPQAADGDMRQLITALHPDLVVLVADAGLGTINLVRLSAEALGDRPLTVYCNRYDGRADLHRRNLGWLSATDGLDVITGIDDLAARVAP